MAERAAHLVGLVAWFLLAWAASDIWGVTAWKVCGGLLFVGRYLFAFGLGPLYKVAMDGTVVYPVDDGDEKTTNGHK